MPWVAFNESGRQVFCTFEEKLANLHDMEASGGYDIPRCSIEFVDGYDPLSGCVCVKDMGTGVITLEALPDDKTGSP